MSEIDDLLAAADGTAHTASRLGDRFARLLASVWRSVDRQVRGLVSDATDGSRSAIIRTARANRTRTEIRDVLERAGYDDLVHVATGDPFETMVSSVLKGRRLAKASAELTTTAARKVEALRQIHLQDLLDEGDTVSRALFRALVRGVFGADRPSAIVDDLGQILDRSEAQIQTLYDTAVSIFGRQVEAIQAGDDPETTFAYMGPADAVTRPFCRQHVGKVYTKAEIDALDNGQLNNVFLTGGGYNCRHQWIEVSKFSALHELVGTDERIPEVAAQLKRAA